MAADATTVPLETDDVVDSSASKKKRSSLVSTSIVSEVSFATCKRCSHCKSRRARFRHDYRYRSISRVVFGVGDDVILVLTII